MINSKTKLRFIKKESVCLYQRQLGFTLIELLVVIAIIGVLSTLVIVALGNSRTSARDSKRLNDLKAMANALELYYADNNEYPSSLTPGDPLEEGGVVYMNKVPSNPTPRTDGDCSDSEYDYESDGLSYTIYTCIGQPTAQLMAGEILISQSGIANSSFLTRFPGAIAAYSFRKLNSSYTGPAVRLSNSKDTQADFYFNNNGYLDMSAVEAWADQNIIINGTFNSASNWSISVPPAGTASIVDGVARYSGASGGYGFLQYGFIYNVGKTYYIEFEIKNYVQGGVRVDMGQNYSAVPVVSGNGIKSTTVTHTTGAGTNFYFVSSGITTLDIDNVVVKELTPSVMTWYDQSGNNKNATYSTRVKRPVLEVNDNKKSIKFNGTNSVLLAPNIGLNNAPGASSWLVSKTSNVGQVNKAIFEVRQALSNNGLGIRYDSNIRSYIRTSASPGDLTGTATNNQTSLIGANFTGSARNLYVNGQLANSAAASGNIESAIDELAIGAFREDTNNALVDIFELILYNSDESSSYNAIQENINNYYSIY